MVDVLGLAGFVGRGEEYAVPAVAWNTLLGCCKVHGDARRGAMAARNAVGISPGFAGSTVLLSNMYAEIGRHECRFKGRGLGLGLIYFQNLVNVQNCQHYLVSVFID
ncbi:hypothetical protein SELMODRAFT_79462 [Selaginella moellendorffii]|uniref:Uncharacterized protein n=1 Tax=Selaginella moellendorffii TaxID=88036 RepID=D8QXN5_SELML|nr:hypothetical protein SELMODRAFT_79462 [Selaginella moellendorffii]